MILPQLVISDIDGVWTDGGMYYDESGNEWKKFNTSDSAGVLFLRLLNIPFAIISGENAVSVKNRAKKLNVKHCFLGVSNKMDVARQLCRDLNVSFMDIAFIGDDINDVPLLQSVGLSATPANAPDYIKSRVHLVTKKSGGEGAFREFVETFLQHHNLLESALSLYWKDKK